MANALVEIYQSMLGSWERSWELIYKAQSGYVRQQGSSIDSFLENGIWITADSLIQEFKFDPLTGENIELITSRRDEPKVGLWDLRVHNSEHERGNPIVHLITATGTVDGEPEDAIDWQQGPYIFFDASDPDRLLSKSSLDQQENNIVMSWSRKQGFADTEIRSLNPFITFLLITINRSAS